MMISGYLKGLFLSEGKLNQSALLSRSLKNPVTDSEDPEENGDPHPVLQVLPCSRVLLLMLWLLFSLVSCLYNLEVNDTGQYVMSATGEMQNIAGADVGERCVRVGYDSWGAFPKDIAQVHMHAAWFRGWEESGKERPMHVCEKAAGPIGQQSREG